MRRTSAAEQGLQVFYPRYLLSARKIVVQDRTMQNWQQEPVCAQSRLLHKTHLIINNNLTEIYLGEYLCWSMLQCPHQSRVSFKITSDCPEHCPGKLRITPRQVGGHSLTWGSNRDSRAQPAGDDSAIHTEKGSKLPGKMRLKVAVAGSAQGLASATEVHNPSQSHLQPR